MPELIRDGDNGFFVERDASDIAAKLARLRDVDLRTRLGRAARASVEAWDWKRQAARFDTVLRIALQTHGPAQSNASAKVTW